MPVKNCPTCGAQGCIVSRTSPRKITVKKEIIEINDHFLFCTQCQEEFNNPDIEFDALEEAYKIYRAKHHFVTPEQITSYRKSLGLTQIEFAKLLGFGDATIQRYESGALQENSHDSAIQMAMTMDGLKKLIEKNSSTIPDEKMALIESYVRKKQFETNIELIIPQEISEFTGNKKFDWNKFRDVIEILCANGQYYTKLNKLLFYADFYYYKIRTVSITGCAYIHLPYGPVPFHYSDLYDMLPAESFLLAAEGIGTKCKSLKKSSPQFLTKDEIDILNAVLNYFKEINSKEISDLSHLEDAYIKTKMHSQISYKFSSSLKLQLEPTN
ncbi:MAG: type II TA system antitoxin MqsA family protein [Bdellovibrionota bacterium]